MENTAASRSGRRSDDQRRRLCEEADRLGPDRVESVLEARAIHRNAAYQAAARAPELTVAYLEGRGSAPRSSRSRRRSSRSSKVTRSSRCSGAKVATASRSATPKGFVTRETIFIRSTTCSASRRPRGVTSLLEQGSRSRRQPCILHALGELKVEMLAAAGKDGRGGRTTSKSTGARTSSA